MSSAESTNTHRQKRKTRRRRDIIEGRSDDEEVEMSKHSEERKNHKPRHATTASRADMVTVIVEDIEEGEIPLAQVTEIVNVSYGDPADGQYDCSKVNWEYAPDRKGCMRRYS
jgi:hypothetical protein